MMSRAPVAGKRSQGRDRLTGVLLSMVLLWPGGQALSHGTHANILSPVEGALVSQSLALHIQKARHAFPYVHVEVRPAGSEAVTWSGLLPLAENGYSVQLNLRQWAAGRYVAQVQFLGDAVEQVQQRSFVVEALDAVVTARD